MAKTPEGDSVRWRPRRLAEEVPAAPLGKRSHFRKGTAAINQLTKIFTFKDLCSVFITNSGVQNKSFS
ncbi:hypothetical protein FZC74_04325 [Sutcliffiella horikoshii]|uniref:Uncharacterized protein n=1 Tax=Sutcliffiella horikoshii TaxID=79883 RepID=A0AA94WSU9_9BACI|nr:hypothetical protein FZC74_04325 [Sutcliffiella horikoshii]